MLGPSATIKEFELNLIECVNRYEIPLEVKRLVLLDLLRQTEIAADNQINEEIRQREEEKQDAGIHEDELAQ